MQPFFCRLFAEGGGGFTAFELSIHQIKYHIFHKNMNKHNCFQHYCFYCISNKINVAWLSIRDFFRYIEKIIFFPNQSFICAQKKRSYFWRSLALILCDMIKSNIEWSFYFYICPCVSGVV